MTIDEAIEVLKEWAQAVGIKFMFMPDIRDAMKLGIEALKFRAECERLKPELKSFPLPGETEE